VRSDEIDGALVRDVEDRLYLQSSATAIGIVDGMSGEKREQRSTALCLSGINLSITSTANSAALEPDIVQVLLSQRLNRYKTGCSATRFRTYISAHRSRFARDRISRWLIMARCDFVDLATRLHCSNIAFSCHPNCLNWEALRTGCTGICPIFSDRNTRSVWAILCCDQWQRAGESTRLDWAHSVALDLSRGTAGLLLGLLCFWQRILASLRAPGAGIRRVAASGYYVVPQQSYISNCAAQTLMTCNVLG